MIVDTTKSPFARLKTLPLTAVEIEDVFWRPRLETLREVTLPSQHELLEWTGRIDNFRRAAGRISGPFRGRYYNDSDVYKWVEGTALALAQAPSPELRSLLTGVVEEIISAQSPDGYLNTYHVREREGERWSDLANKHELYCAGHLIEAAIAHWRATGEEKLLAAARRLADHIYSRFGPGKEEGVPGHPEIELALVELFRLTRDRRYLELAKAFLDRRGKGLIGGRSYHIDQRPFRELEELTGHAVRALYLNSGAADLYLETGDPSLLNALERLWHDLVERKMYVTGGVGSRYEGEAFGYSYELPNLRAYAETCAAIANVIWNWRMLLITGEARFADVMELALYNAALVGISLSGKKYFYANPLASLGDQRRQPWFDCACCPTNIIRLLAALPHFIYTTSPEGIWVHLYIGSRVTLNHAGSQLGISQETDYPWEGEAEFRVDSAPVGPFSLFFRIPDWAVDVHLSLNGDEVPVSAVPGSYVELRRRWQTGDRVRLAFPLPVQRLISHPWVEASQGRVALKRGPLVYCLEGADNPGMHVWDVMLPDTAPLATHRLRNELGEVVVIKGRGELVSRKPWQGRLYVPPEEAGAEVAGSTEFTAIPYYAWANREPGPMTVWLTRKRT